MSTWTEKQQWIAAQLKSVTGFWLSNGIDPVHGGVYTCIGENGKVFSTDKSAWMQGRCGWIFSYLCRVYGIKQQWLDAAKSCLDFMENHCIHPENGRMYFTVTADDRPLRQRRYYYSEAFYCMANAEYYGLTGERNCLERALRDLLESQPRRGRSCRSAAQIRTARPQSRHPDDPAQRHLRFAAGRSRAA